MTATRAFWDGFCRGYMRAWFWLLPIKAALFVWWWHS